MKLTTDRVRTLVLIWTMFLSVFTWTPVMRAVLRPELSGWGLLGYSGSGASGAFWVLPAAGLFALAMFYIEGRGRVRPLFHAMLLTWHIALSSIVLSGAMRYGDSATFVGGAWGVQVGFPLLSIPFVAFTVLAVLLVVRERRDGSQVPVAGWTTINRRPLIIALALFPVAWFFFQFAGANFDWKGKLAIATNVVQWILIIEAVNDPRLMSHRSDGTGQGRAAGGRPRRLPGTDVPG
jgi:hypothetical protein